MKLALRSFLIFSSHFSFGNQRMWRIRLVAVQQQLTTRNCSAHPFEGGLFWTRNVCETIAVPILVVIEELRRKGRDKESISGPSSLSAAWKQSLQRRYQSYCLLPTTLNEGGLYPSHRSHLLRSRRFVCSGHLCLWLSLLFRASTAGFFLVLFEPAVWPLTSG